MDEFSLMKAQILASIDGHNSCIHRRASKNNVSSIEPTVLMENGTTKMMNNNKCIEEKSDTKAETVNKDCSNHQISVNEYKKLRKLLCYDDAPKYLQFNSYIRNGYRNLLPTKLCLESIFWWTNETINIWSHIFGWFLFLGLSFVDITFLNIHATSYDKIVVCALLICFQMCMILSSVYHTFSCRSEKDYDCFLAYDLFGIALSLFAIYISGIYYAFWCHDKLRNFYIFTVGAIFIAALILQIPKLKVHSNVKMIMFVAWAAYGVIPTIHWTIEMGGFENAMVRLLIPRVIGMYIIVGLAFLIYITRIPERWFTGKVDYLGHSHNLWHILVVCALYYWHNTGMMYAIHMIENGCLEDRIKCYQNPSDVTLSS
uniref:Progestin and adipoQ receptor family member 3 n=1 Tax=Lutzomyia longipalpis TaxID=7200 RepID=A0A1B0CSH2_LUTLO